MMSLSSLKSLQLLLFYFAAIQTGSNVSGNPSSINGPEYIEDQQIIQEINGNFELEQLSIPFDRGPYIDTSSCRNVTALVGKTAQLHCRVRNLGNRTVSWIRHRDIHLLTAGRMTYTSDQRFQSLHSPLAEEWILKIRFPQTRDSGIYECQVSTTPPIGHSMYLSIVEPVTTIAGWPELFINTGSTINLTCIVKHSPEPPSAIYWTHNDLEINYDSPRGGVSVITEKGDVTTSYLLIQRARSSDTGRYLCSPANANPHAILVHVLNGEHPAAMQHGGQLRLNYPIFTILISIFTTIMGS